MRLLFDLDPTWGFIQFIIVTVALLLAVVITGFKAKRRLHLTLVVCAVLSLGVTIYYAEKLGELYDLESAGWIYPVHLAIAKATTAAYLLPVITGIATIKNPIRRNLHRRMAYFVIAMTVLTAVTGSWMVFVSDKL